MGVPSSRVSHQACSSELDPGELIKFQWYTRQSGPYSCGAFGSQGSCSKEKDSCIQGAPDISRDPPQTGSPTALWQNYCRECTLADQSSRGMLFVLGLLAGTLHWPGAVSHSVTELC